ncbi:peptidyl-tRNA hydrolase [Tricholoma matsutake]|nr:peptidyl-tRNA hydrolase [Tricholoma matsutake 945]
MVVSIPQVLVVGLGNLPFPLTRHSVGQRIVDSLAFRLGIPMRADKAGISGQNTVTIGDTQLSLTLFKSKSLMNVSGPSVAATFRKTVRSPSSLIVIADSLDHGQESLSVKFGGSANGHNGIKSIISALGGEMGFYRFRIGIGRDESPATYVMGKLSSHERQFWDDEGLDLILAEIENVARKSLT